MSMTPFNDFEGLDREEISRVFDQITEGAKLLGSGILGVVAGGTFVSGAVESFTNGGLDGKTAYWLSAGTVLGVAALKGLKNSIQELF